VVAVDHALFNNAAFLDGIENMEKTVNTLADANPDALLLSPGEAPHLQKIGGRDKPALMLRADTANFYNDVLPTSKLFCQAYESAVEVAVRLDAACILLNLLQVDDFPEMLEQCVKNILKLKNVCDQYGMPMGVEPLSFKRTKDGMVGDGKTSRVVTLARMAAELGADIIKTDSTDDEDDFHRVIEAASGVPVTVRGGSKASSLEVLEHTEKLVGQGVAGIVYGRNVIQHKDPKGMTRALQAVLHDGCTARDAMQFIKSEAAVAR
jgi:DhnA family fructose-bisphosphate aldolase class Ia